jgi:hypothetical protein
MAGTKMIVFGGWDGEKALADVHVLDTGMRAVRVRAVRCLLTRDACGGIDTWAWEKVKTSGCMPQARHGHSAAYLRYTATTTATALGSDHTCPNVTLGVRCVRAMCVHAQTHSGVMYVFGGRGFGTSYLSMDKVLMLNTDTYVWEEKHAGGDVPSPRYLHTTTSNSLLHPRLRHVRAFVRASAHASVLTAVPPASRSQPSNC